jgi:hypothetical protein
MRETRSECTLAAVAAAAREAALWEVVAAAAAGSRDSMCVGAETLAVGSGTRERKTLENVWGRARMCTVRGKIFDAERALEHRRRLPPPEPAAATDVTTRGEKILRAFRHRR